MCELADSYRPGPWVRCLWKALSWAWPSGVSDVWGKFGLLLPGHLLSDNTDQRYKSMTWLLDISGKLRLHSHRVKPYMYMFLPSFLAASKNRVLSIHSHLFLVSFLKILPVLMQQKQRGLITITGMTVFCSTSTYYSREHHHIALKSLCFATWAGTNTHG